MATIRPMTGDDTSYRLQLSETNRSLTLLLRDKPDDTPPVAHLRYEEPEANKLTWVGTYEGKPLRATLRRVDESKFPINRQ